MLDALNAVDVQPGDVLFVPAGTPHAIGEGVLLVELQEPSDLSILLEWRGFAAARTRRASAWAGTSRCECVDRAGDRRRPAARAIASPPRPTASSAPSGSRPRRRPSSTAASRSSSSPRAPASCARGRRAAAGRPRRHRPRPVGRGSLPARGRCRSRWPADRRPPTREARRDRPPAGHRRRHLGLQGGPCRSSAGVERAHGQSTTPWRRVPTGAEVDRERAVRGGGRRGARPRWPARPTGGCAPSA